MTRGLESEPRRGLEYPKETVPLNKYLQMLQSLLELGQTLDYPRLGWLSEDSGFQLPRSALALTTLLKPHLLTDLRPSMSLQLAAEFVLEVLLIREAGDSRRIYPHNIQGSITSFPNFVGIMRDRHGRESTYGVIGIRPVPLPEEYRSLYPAFLILRTPVLGSLNESDFSSPFGSFDPSRLFWPIVGTLVKQGSEDPSLALKPKGGHRKACEASLKSASTAGVWTMAGITSLVSKQNYDPSPDGQAFLKSFYDLMEAWRQRYNNVVG